MKWNQCILGFIQSDVFCQTYFKWTRDVDVNISWMPFWSLVVCCEPDFGSFIGFEQVDIEGHCCGWPIHMVPEVQAKWAIVMAHWAQQTGWVPMCCIISFDVQVETRYRHGQEHKRTCHRNQCSNTYYYILQCVWTLGLTSCGVVYVWSC